MRRMLPWLLTLTLAACGSDKPTPEPKQDNSQDQKKKSEGPDPSSQDQNTPTEILNDLHTSEGKRWQVNYTWSAGPKYGGDEEIFENKLKLVFRTGQGEVPKVVKDVKLVAWMFEHGHGTGNRQPSCYLGSQGQVNVDGLVFTMEGRWTLIITANVDGLEDKFSFEIDV